MELDKNMPRQDCKNYSRKRRALRWNARAAIFLAAALVIMLNYIASRHGRRVDLSQARYFALTPATLQMLDKAPGPIKIIALMSPSHELFRDIRGLLREYAFAGDKVQVEFVDPHRDLARSKELALRYDISGPNYLLFETQDRLSGIPLSELADYDYTPILTGGKKNIKTFRGEHVVSSAIHGLLQPRKPVVAFLAGHGEKNIEDFDPMHGYSEIARLIRRNNLDVKTVYFESDAMPTCDVLVVAGPTRRLSNAETDIIKNMLNKSGRLFLLLDSGIDAGLDGLLAEWGVRVGDDRVVGLTLTGRELLVNRYGNHPITDRMQNLTTIFNLPRSIQPLLNTNAPPDRPQATVLASTTEKGWADTSAFQSPPKFDPETDQRGPIPVAMAVERGATQNINVELKTARLVVFGDSSMVVNGALAAGYPCDLFLNALNWLAESGQGPEIAPRPPPTLRINISRNSLNLLYWLLGAGLPLSAVVAGIFVRWWRRK
jgi:ABC-type uncharacterized transport system involved in gliding motility auxiliary subunit